MERWLGPHRASLRLVDLWNSAFARLNPASTILFLWAALTLPLVLFRGFNGDEGLAVSIARSALEKGDWLTPYVFNIRFAERPTLLSWIIGLVSAPFGGVSQITARLVVALFLLLGCFLIDWLLKTLRASNSARVLGVALFLACPLVQRAYVLVTADMPLAVLLFCAFCLWWSGYSRGSLKFARWVAVGVALALAGLLKGPQPLAYFAFGIGAFIVWHRAWNQIPGYVFAGLISAVVVFGWYWYVYSSGDEAQWAHFMRLGEGVPLRGPFKEGLQLLAETLPVALFSGLFFVSCKIPRQDRQLVELVRAIALYSSITSIIMLFWPNGSDSRYFFPMLLPLAVLGAMAFDFMAAKRPETVAPGLVILLGLLAYCFIYSWASPFFPNQFRSSKVDAARIERVVGVEHAPIYRTGGVGLNVMPYLTGPILETSVQRLESAKGPAWVAVTVPEAAMLMQRRAGKIREVLSFGSDKEWRLLELSP